MKYASSLKAAVASAALLAGSGMAFAADAPIYDKGVVSPAPMVAPMWSWTGFYIGANAGYGWGNIDNSDNGIFGRRDFDLDADGGLVGGQVGYNWQMDNFVFGVETDLQYADLSSSNTRNVYDFDLDGTADDFIGLGAELNWFGAYGDADVGFSFGGDVNDTFLRNGDDSTRVGYTVGGGLEYAFTDHVSAKAEYLYVNLGDQDYSAVYRNGAAVPVTYANSTDFDAHIVRAGLNYKF